MADKAQMEQLMAGIRGGLRVRILKQVGQGSASPVVAEKSGHEAFEANLRGERVARLEKSNGEPLFEVGVTADQVLVLVKAGASVG